MSPVQWTAMISGSGLPYMEAAHVGPPRSGVLEICEINFRIAWPLGTFGRSVLQSHMRRGLRNYSTH